MPQIIPEHVFDINYIFLIAFERKDSLEFHFALDDSVYCRNDFLKLTDMMMKFFERLSSQKDLTMRELMK